MEGSTTESVGASTAEIPGVFGRGIVENESLAAFGEVKCAGRSGGSGGSGIGSYLTDYLRTSSLFEGEGAAG